MHVGRGLGKNLEKCEMGSSALIRWIYFDGWRMRWICNMII